MAKKVKLFAKFRSKFDLMMRQRDLNGAKALIKVVCLDESYEQIGLRGLLTQNLPKEYEEAITRQYLNKMERMLQIDEAACMAEFKYAPKPHENIRAVYDETTGKMFDQLSIGITSWLTPQDSSKVMAATINWDHLIYFWPCSYLIGKIIRYNPSNGSTRLVDIDCRCFYQNESFLVQIGNKVFAFDQRI